MLFYRAALPLPSRTLAYLAGIIRRHRAVAGSRWRKLNPARQALLVLACLRGETFAEPAGFGAGVTTAPKIREPDRRPAGGASAQAAQRGPGRDEEGAAHAVADGTLIPLDAA